MERGTNLFEIGALCVWDVASSRLGSGTTRLRADSIVLWYAINYGIKTGLNEAFIVDNQTKDALVNADPKSAEILKPVVRGRDIRRYKAVWRGLWLIATFPAAGVNIDDYPAVKKHLLTFGKARLEQSGTRLPDGTRSRKKTNNAWYEMQDTCAYHADFAHEKLFWMDLTDSGRFAYEDSERFCLNTVFMMTGQELKYHCAVLNSRPHNMADEPYCAELWHGSDQVDRAHG